MSDARRGNLSLFLDHQVDAGRADQAAVICGDERVTYGELRERAARTAGALHDLEVRREERVLLLLDDTPAFPATFLGAIRLGAVPVPVNPLYKPSDFRYFLEDSYARVVVADPAFAEKAAEAIEGLAPADRNRVRVFEPADLLEAGGDAEGLPAAATHEDDMAFWLYSSGSTGRPKGVVHRQADAAAICETYGASVLALTDADVTYSTTKLYHAYGIGNGMFFPYWAGATTVLTPGRPSPEAIFSTVETRRPTAFFSVPTLYNALVNAEGAKGRDFSSVRICLSAAEPLPPEVFRRFEETWGLPILDGIGSTEMLHIYCSNTAGARRPGSSGRPVPGYELMIRDDDGQPAAPGEVGELLVKGDSALSGYWHHRDKTRRTLIGEYFATGDRYRVDDDGFYWYEGRGDDMIKVGGLWASPIEIENVLMEHWAVLEAGVVGVDVDGFMKIRAHVIPQPDLTLDQQGEGLVTELQNLCKERLQRYQYPHIVRFEKDLPKTMTGKIQRYLLRGRHVIDGIPLVDAHLHPARLSTLKMPVQEWAAGFNSMDGIYDSDGAVIPSAFDAYLDAEGVDVAILFCEYSPLSTGVQPIEDLLPLAAANPTRMRFLANVNPHLHDPLLTEVDRQLALGAVGLKLHPVHARFSPNDAVLWPIYARLEEAGLPVVFHCGTSVFPGAVNRYADPGLVDEVAGAFPDLTIVLAHGGRGWWYDAAAFITQMRANVWIELAGLPPKKLPQYYRNFDLGRLGRKFIFATDWPGVPGIARNAAAVADLGFDRDTLELIFWRNAFAVYALGDPPPAWG